MENGWIIFGSDYHKIALLLGSIPTNLATNKISLGQETKNVCFMSVLIVPCNKKCC